MRTISFILIISYSLTKVCAQDSYEKVAASFVLDSTTIYAVDQGRLDPADFIRYTMDDTSLFHGFSLLNTYSHQMILNAHVSNLKKREGKVKRQYLQTVCDDCIEQSFNTIDSSGYFSDRKNRPLSETYTMMLRYFTHPKKKCNMRLPVPPKGIVVLDKPKDLKQQKELIKRFIFAPHTIRVEVPFFGNKMKTNIFEQPTADYYKFKVYFDLLNDSIPVYNFNISVDTLKYPNWEKSILIKKMNTTFRAEDLAIIQRSYDLFYPGWLASCDLSIDIEMQEYNNHLLPKSIHYQGEWKFPTKGKEKADVMLKFHHISTEECLK